MGQEIRLPDPAPPGEQCKPRFSGSKKLAQLRALSLSINQHGVGNRMGWHACKHIYM